MVQIAYDTILLQRETNPLWPQFQNVSPLEKTIYMPELVNYITTI